VILRTLQPDIQFTTTAQFFGYKPLPLAAVKLISSVNFINADDLHMLSMIAHRYWIVFWEDKLFFIVVFCEMKLVI
jgi:hypothetical protein